MKKSLAAINEIIREVECNLTNGHTLKTLCEKLEETLHYIEAGLLYHYKLFLAEVYATKLQQIQKAEDYCKEILSDTRTHVKVEALLRLSYFYSIDSKYKEALSELERVMAMGTDGQPELQMIMMNFFGRLMESSRDSQILRALKYHHENDYHAAVQQYEQEFKSESGFESDENRYFAACEILRLCSIFKEENKFQVDQEKYEQLKESLESEDERSLLEDKYTDRKRYLSKMINFMANHERRKAKDYDSSLCAKKILAIYKLKGALAKMRRSSKGPIEEIDKSLQELKKNKICNPNMLNEFVRKEYEVYEKANKIHAAERKAEFQWFYEQLRRFYDEQEYVTAVGWAQLPDTKSVVSQAELGKFKGSEMFKVNEHSSGYDKRYFYFRHDEIRTPKMKLYYASKVSKVSKGDDFYEVRDLKKILTGKMTKALKRSECKDFEERLCFSLEFKDGEHKNFYVPRREDFECWMAVFTIFLDEQSLARDKSKKLLNGNTKSQFPSVSPIKKSKIIRME